MRTRANQMKIFAATAAIGLSGAASADVIAYDMVDSTSQGIISYTNAFNGAFSSAGDGFQMYQRGVSGSIPFAVLDDSTFFPSDGVGIIDTNNEEVFFGIVDTVNTSNPGGTATASWQFDISGFGDLSLSIDMGAMGDFEDDDPSASGEDFFTWAYSIDGGPLIDIFDTMVDEAASLDYTLESGSVISLADPMSVNGTQLNNQLQTIAAGILGSGSVLELVLTGQFNGGSEAVAFQNLIISGTAVAEPAMLALFGAGLIGLVLARRRA